MAKNAEWNWMSFYPFASFEINPKSHSIITKTWSHIANCEPSIQTLA